MTRLSVNLNKIALLRNSRGRNYPDMMQFAELAINAGANGITIHPRPDERHARFSDALLLKQLTKKYPERELNIEGYPSDVFIETILQIKPHQCTLVPDTPKQITSDHGWNLSDSHTQLNRAIAKLKQAGIRVSLFMDPDIEQIEIAKNLGIECIELFTEQWAKYYNTSSQKTVYEQYSTAIKAGQELGLRINAGHDLNLENIFDFLTISNVEEVSIGHALIVESLLLGFSETISRYLEICSKASKVLE